MWCSVGLTYCRSLFRMCSVRVFLPILLYSTVVCIVHYTVWRVGLDSLARHSVWSRQPWSPLVHSTTPPVGYHTWPTYVFTVQCVLRSSLLLTSNLFRLGWLLPHTRSIFGIFKVFLCLVVWPHPPWFCTPRLGCGRVALQYCCSPDSLTFCIGYTC